MEVGRMGGMEGGRAYLLVCVLVAVPEEKAHVGRELQTRRNVQHRRAAVRGVDTEGEKEGGRKGGKVSNNE